MKPVLAISCKFASEKRQALLRNRVAMATLQATDELNKVIFFDALCIDSNSLNVLLSYC